MKRQGPKICQYNEPTPFRGRNNREIATTLFISEDTVKTHLKNVFGKLGVEDRTGAVLAAVRQGIVYLE